MLLRPPFRRKRKSACPRNSKSSPKAAPAPTSWSTSSSPSASNTSAPIPARASAACTNRVINYGGNKNPEFITCCHEESSVAMAHGYAKIEGKPHAVFAHGTVGLQHASMAIYNACCDRVPVYMIVGNTSMPPSASPRWNGRTACRMPPPWCATSPSGTICPFLLPHFAESAVRAYKIAMTPPMHARAAGGRWRTAGKSHSR